MQGEASARREGLGIGARIAPWVAAYVALLVVVLAVYQGSLRQFFVADDFAHLRFLREMRAPLFRYLDPTFSPSDPVTTARYVPVKLLVHLACERCFGLHAAAYHALSIALHALNALLVGSLAWTAFRERTVGVLAALTFATTRLNAQNVCWAACIPNLVAATLLLAAVGLYLRSRERIGSSLLGPLLLLLSFLCRTDGMVVVAFLAPLWAKDAVRDRRRAPAVFALLSTACACAVAAASWISQRCFPEPHARLGVEPRRFLAFLADLFVPWELPVAAKAALVLGVLLAAAALRDRRVGYALYGIGLGGLFWTVVVYLDLTPRYFYAYTSLSSTVLAVLLHRGCARLIPRAPGARAVALGLGLLFCGWNGWLARRADVVWFDYLSITGRALARLADQQRAAGAARPLRVRMVPYLVLTDADLAFFQPWVEVVKAGEGALALDAGAGEFARYYGEELGAGCWYYPWFWR